MSSHALITRNTLGLGLLSLSAMAHAQTDTAVPPLKNYPPVEVINTPLEYRQFEKIEITGSSIIARQAKEALPVQVISRHEIERSGATNLPQLLQKLPTMFNFQESGSMTGTREGGPETAAIHGNATGTLVLLNGRRLPSYGSQAIILDRSMVDLNLVPLSAIERIDVLTDGASSRYGSDALAGVVNIITKTSTKGLALSAELTRPAGGFAQGQMAGVSWGSGRIEDQGYRLQVHFSAEKQNALRAGDVTNASNGAVPLNIDGQTLWASPWVSQHGWPPSIYNTASETILHPVLQRTGQCPNHWYKVENGTSSECWRNTQANLTLYPATEKQMLFVDAEIQLSSDWRGFSQIMTGREAQDSVPLEGVDIAVNLDNGNQAMIDTSVIGVIRQSYRNRRHQVVVGAKGLLNGWDVSASASTGQHRVTRVYTDGVRRSAAEFNGVVLSSADLDQSSMSFSPELLAKYAVAKRTTERQLDDGYTRLNALDLLGSSEIGQTDDGPISLGLGWNWRQEAVDYRSPEFATLRPAFSGQRQNWAIHSEVQTPLTAHQEVILAMRHDQYSDFGGVQTGKVAWRWRPQSGWMLRSSIGTGFRAPTLGQMTTVTTNIFEITDTVTDTILAIRNAGNYDLKPEKSTQATLGFRWDPSPHWTMGADFWHLHIRDTFGTFDHEQVLASQELRAKYIVNEGGATYLNLSNLNLGQSQRQGIDYDIQWRQPTDIGRVRVALQGTWNLRARKQVYEGAAYESELGQYANNTQSFTPKHQLKLSAGLERGDWNVLTALNYRSGFSNTMALTTAIYSTEDVWINTRVPGFWTVDLGGNWKPDKAWTLTAHIQNLTNRTPSWILVESAYLLGVDTRFANYYGRTIKLKAAYKF